MSSICRECGLPSPVRLEHGALCAACRSREAWSRFEARGDKLVIDRADIDEALARRSGTREPSRWYRLVPLFSAAVSIALAATCVWMLARAFARRHIGPLGELFS